MQEMERGKTSANGPLRAEPALSELEFVGCYARPMTLVEYEAYEGRVEFFDSRAEIAWLARATALAPDRDPLEKLGRLAERIALVRGSEIVCRSQAGIWRIFEDGLLRRVQWDRIMVLDQKARDRAVPRGLTVREDPNPDVVVDVECATELRGYRRELCEDWGFPEVWLEVPNAFAPSQPAVLRPGLGIYVLEGGRYAPSSSSRAFPGWRADEIHRALNEPVISEETSKVLSRVGRALGEREGTGPEDDPLLRSQRAAGRIEGRAELARAMLTRRGVTVALDFPSPDCRAALAASSAVAIVSAASAAPSEPEFVARLAGDSK